MGPLQQQKLLYTEARLARLWEALDEIHSAASEGALRSITPLTNAEVVGWLNELIYTAQEAIEEIESHSADPEPKLTLVRKPSEQRGLSQSEANTRPSA
jgi:hypothetical protein